jgi:hypothetical protein
MSAQKPLLLLTVSRNFPRILVGPLSLSFGDVQAATPNGHKVAIALEELKDLGEPVDYEVKPIDMSKLEQKEDWFLKVCCRLLRLDGVRRTLTCGFLLQDQS